MYYYLINDINWKPMKTGLSCALKIMKFELAAFLLLKGGESLDLVVSLNGFDPKFTT